MQDVRPEGQTSQNGYVVARCRNHPTLTWSMKDPRTAHLRISRDPQIHMIGDSERPDAMVWPDYQNVPEKIRNDPAWVVECACPGSDLVIFANSESQMAQLTEQEKQDVAFALAMIRGKLA